MKLASVRDGSRDGQLIVVSRDLALAHYASAIAGRLQQVLDDWNFLSPQLEELSQTLNHGKARHAFAFDPASCLAPLPRAFHRAAAAPGGDRPVVLAGDDLLGPCDPIADPAATGGIAFAAGFAAITGDVAAGSTPEAAIEGIRLLLLANDITLPEPGDDAPRPVATAFGPVAVTPDELGDAWRGGCVHATLECRIAGRRLGAGDAAAPRSFGRLIAALTRFRPVRAGAIVAAGAAQRGTLDAGDVLRIAAGGDPGAELFGTIEQRLGASA